MVSSDSTNTSFTTLMTMSLLWTIAGDGINRLISAALFLFSGMVVPLPLFPDWLQPVLNALPFRGLADTPFRIYMGHIPPEQALAMIMKQLGGAPMAGPPEGQMPPMAPPGGMPMV